MGETLVDPDFTDPTKMWAPAGAEGTEARSKKDFLSLGWCLAGLGKPEDWINSLSRGS